MGTICTIKYSVPTDGAGIGAIQAALAAVPVPQAVLDLYGLRVTSDATTAANPSVRTIVLSFVPTATATAIAALVPGDASGSPLRAIAGTAPGDNYVRPPAVVFAGGGPDREARARCTLDVQTGVPVTGGAAYNVLQTVAFVIGGMAAPTQGRNGDFTVPSCVQDFVIAPGGKGKNYSPTTIVQLLGGLGPGGVPATAQATIVNGKLTAISVVNPGAGYIRAPKVFLYDPAGLGSGAKIAAQMGAGTPAIVTPAVPFGILTGLAVVSGGSGYISVPRVLIFDPTGAGSGATARVTMGVGAYEILDRGLGYKSVPAVTLVPLFKSFYPDPNLVAQGKPFWALMETAIGLACISPVHSDPPVVT